MRTSISGCMHVTSAVNFLFAVRMVDAYAVKCYCICVPV